MMTLRRRVLRSLPTLFVDPTTGALLNNPVLGSTPVLDFDAEREAALLVLCRLHGRWELANRIDMAGKTSAATLLTLARVILAAAAWTCETYRRWKRPLSREYRDRLKALPADQRARASYTLIADLVHQRVPPADALRALRTLRMPTFPARAWRSIDRPALLSRVTGTVRYATGSLSAPSEFSALPRDRQWLIAPCSEHGWELYDALPGWQSSFVGNPWDEANDALACLGRALISTAANSCDDYAARTKVLASPALQVLHLDRSDPRFWMQVLLHSRACGLYQTMYDTPWLVAELLADLASR